MEYKFKLQKKNKPKASDPIGTPKYGQFDTPKSGWFDQYICSEGKLSYPDKFIIPKIAKESWNFRNQACR